MVTMKCEQELGLPDSESAMANLMLFVVIHNSV